MKPKAQAAIPPLRLVDVVEIVGDGTSMGKTTLADRLCHLYRETGRRVTLVQIETNRRQISRNGGADNYVFIPTEDFTTAAARTGGLVGVLSPLFDAILAAAENGDAVVVDWPGGQTSHRLEVLAATGFDNLLSTMNLRAASLVMTTCSADHMSQAESYLKRLKIVAPLLQRVLVLSARSGSFQFPKASEQADVFARLMAEATDTRVARIPLVAGRALQVCADAGIDAAEAMSLPAPALAKRIKGHVFAAAACASEIALWWKQTANELAQVLGINSDATAS